MSGAPPRAPAARSLPRATLGARTVSASLESLGFAGLCEQCRAGTAAHTPDALSSRDPRGTPIAYSEARAGRPVGLREACPVCGDETCAAVDVANLPDGDLAWLTPNLYPILFPFEAPRSAAAPIPGVHLVQWSSLRHDGGLVGAEPATATAIVAQWSRAEEFLLHRADARFPESGAGQDGLPHRGHCGLVKNRGRNVGGSVEHDHQQLLLSAVPFAEPPLTAGLAEALLRDATPARTLERLDGALVLVPSFMRRPLQAFIVPLAPGASPGGPPRAARAGWLHHLPVPTRDALAVAMARLARAVSVAMERRGAEPAWNMILHTGPGCAPLLELRPHTQPVGGFEQLGLWLCEERPETSAARLREGLAG